MSSSSDPRDVEPKARTNGYIDLQSSSEEYCEDIDLDSDLETVFWTDSTKSTCCIGSTIKAAASNRSSPTESARYIQQPIQVNGDTFLAS